MNKNLFSSLLILALSFFTLSSFYTKDNLTPYTKDNLTPEEEILLEAAKTNPTRSLLVIPDIKAYINDEVISLVFNESVSYGVLATIYNEAGEVFYSETIYPNSSSFVHSFFLDLDRTDSYTLVISGVGWTLTGKF